MFVKTKIRIEICASLGTGKTTLARALANHGFTPVYEEFDKNPHLQKFYETPNAGHAYAKDLWFIKAQEKQLLATRDVPGKYIVDYAQILSMSYIDAGANSPQNKAALIEKWQDVMQNAGAPDLLIVLDLPLDQQMARIKSRGRDGEIDLPRDFVINLNNAIEKRLETLPKHIKVLRIDARRNFNDSAEIAKLHKEILSTLKAGRGPKNSYLNFK